MNQLRTGRNTLMAWKPMGSATHWPTSDFNKALR